ncbi:MAG TPA: AzlC family ABC transporter permease [Ktedonobacterales bacterium]|jgi:4-azaleucine resistance transporter AzlC
MVANTAKRDISPNGGGARTEQTPAFTVAGALAGVRRCVPLALSTLAVGLVFGVAARQVGLSLAEAVLMSGLVSAGTAQFVALGLWAAPLPVLSIILTTLVINLRHVLMGAALRPWLRVLPVLLLYVAAFFMDDESFALTMREVAVGGRDRAFLLGSGVAMFVSWVAATALGYVLGAVLPAPVRQGLDFVFIAAFVALLVGLWRGRADVVPWAVAAVVALAAARWLPGAWYIVLGGLAGSLVGMVRHAD